MEEKSQWAWQIVHVILFVCRYVAFCLWAEVDYIIHAFPPRREVVLLVHFPVPKRNCFFLLPERTALFSRKNYNYTYETQLHIYVSKYYNPHTVIQSKHYIEPTDMRCLHTCTLLTQIMTSSNQRLWEYVRRRINFYTDILNDFPSWLSTSKNQPVIIDKRAFNLHFRSLIQVHSYGSCPQSSTDSKLYSTGYDWLFLSNQLRQMQLQLFPHLTFQSLQ